MNQLFLVFDEGALNVVKIAVERYVSSRNFCKDWYKYLSEQDTVAKYLEKIFGICRLEALSLLGELYSTPSFHERGA